ncbi:sulfatase [Halanaeroarchaeum sulfurireducens]|uniref:Sulfatase n=1 Tax=Halanaeroarchaeum sulfurireducens TaxID=1604004 RepID=A0A0F7PBE9_9EURY|nr:sulfatase [Halanaeroarchaeum sulfurireducens]AKH97500.1 sulfatase [Halanaeroarchaeum sulfurireducens]ALG81896.1 sulfatase [Halanaeroarchaeum sulfurireducens]
MNDGSPENVLFIVLDTVRKDRLGPYGYGRDTTPNLSAFAEEATVFESAIAPAPWTLPVHASMFTGLYPSQHGADQESPYLEGAQTLATTLSNAGYDTAAYSSNAWITPYTNLTEGFDDGDTFFEVMPGDYLSGPLSRIWKAMNDSERLRDLASGAVQFGAKIHEYLASGDGADTKTPSVIDNTTEFVAGSDAEEGWFAFINLMDAHLPYYPPEEYRQRFAPDADPDAVTQNSKTYNSGAREIDDAEWADIRALYDAEIAHMDAQLGRLFDWLKQTGRWENTTVIVCADHGELHGEHDLYGHEFSLYDELINVPLMVKHPALDRERRDETVELLDLYHTVLHATDVVPTNAPTTGVDDGRVVEFDRTRSLFEDTYRQFDDVDTPDPGQRANGDADRDYAFAEYAQPVIELHHLEEKAADAGIAIPDDHRARARLRTARSHAGKFIRADRIPDEGFDLREDPDESRPLDTTDDAVAAAERVLSTFESATGGAWTEAVDGRADALDDADEKLQQRLSDLGYME